MTDTVYMIHTVCINGPMTGQPLHNVPAFEAEAIRLRAAGYTVLSPHELPGRQQALNELAKRGPIDLAHRLTPVYKEMLRAFCQQVLEADALQLLPGWEDSTGAIVGLNLALAVGIKVFTPEAPLD
jgi:hypothetical protein